MQSGSLFPYVKNVKLYKCPTGIRGEMVTYSIVASMWGSNATRFSFVGQGLSEARSSELLYSRKSQILRPVERFVFLDEGK
ncbi:hypothetical protein ACFLZ8_06185 [Planctomycetota bacterium]